MSTADAPHPDRSETAHRPRLRLKTPLDLAEAIPYLFGYHPQDSVVILGLAKGRVGMSMRLDLDDDLDQIVDASVEYLRADWPEQVLIAIYDTTVSVRAAANGIAQVNAPLLAARLRSRFTTEEVGVREVILVRHGRCWSLVCTDTRCCPKAGWELPDPEPIVVSSMAAALGTAVPVASRAELAHAIIPVTGTDAELMAAALDDAAGFLAAVWSSIETPEDDDLCRRSLARDAINELEDLLARWEDGIASVPTGFAATFIVSLIDAHLRDMVIAHCLTREDLAPYEAFFVELSRLAVEDWGAPPLTCAALMAWQRGSGTRARVAIDAALGIDPDYRLAQLIEHALDVGMPPQVWHDAVRDLVI